MKIKALSNIGDPSWNMAFFQTGTKLQNFQRFNEENCQENNLTHVHRINSLCHNWNALFSLITSYFLYNASNLMLNKIPHAELPSPATLENGIIQGFHCERRVTKTFTDVNWDGWEVNFSHLLVCTCSFKWGTLKHVEQVTHHKALRSREAAWHTPNLPGIPPEYDPSSAQGTPGRCGEGSPQCGLCAPNPPGPKPFQMKDEQSWQTMLTRSLHDQSHDGL